MGRRKLTKILLQAGCDPTLKNQQNETPMDIALRKSFKEVQEIIANPPPLRLQRSVSMTRFASKKREKESSQEGSSKTSGRRARKDRLSLKKVIHADSLLPPSLSLSAATAPCVQPFTSSFRR